MTVSTELSHEEYTGNGVTTDFDFRFRILKAEHLVVSVADQDGTERILTNGTDYTLRGVGSYRGGKVILKMPLATGWKIGIARDLPVVQETDLRNQGKFFAEVHEDAFDYLTMLIQKSLGYLSLCLRKPSFISDYYDAKGNKISNLGKPEKDGDAVDLSTMTEHISAKDKRSLRVADKDIPVLPNTANRANKMLAFDNDGNPKVVLPESGSAADVLIELGKPDGFYLIGGLQKNYIRVFNTLNDAKLNIEVNIGDVIKTKGYHSFGDGGHAEYRIVETGINDDDGGMFVDLPASNTQAQLIHSGSVNVSVYGIDRDAGDISPCIMSINKNMCDAMINGAYTVKSRMMVDVYKGGIKGINQGMLKIDPDSFQEWNTAVIFFSSMTSYQDRPMRMNCVASENMLFDMGDKTVFQVGYTDATWSHDMHFKDGAIYKAKSIWFIDSWRPVFTRFTIERCNGIPLEQKASSKGGEVMAFYHGWLVDNLGDSTLESGEWRFYSCSLPAGSYQGRGTNTINLSNNATASFDGGNIELQPNHSFPAFKLTGDSSLSVTNSGIHLPDSGAGVDVGIINVQDNAMLNMNNCSISMYGSAFRMEENEPTRQIIGGRGGVINSNGCFPRSGVLHDWNKCAILTPRINKVFNCSGEHLNNSGWDVVNVSGENIVVSSVGDHPNNRMFSTSLKLSVPPNSVGRVIQDVQITESNRWLQIGFWGKSSNNEIGFEVYAYNTKGQSLPWRSTGSENKLWKLNWGVDWKFYAMLQPIPRDCVKIRIQAYSSGMSGGIHYLHNVIIGAI